MLCSEGQTLLKGAPSKSTISLMELMGTQEYGGMLKYFQHSAREILNMKGTSYMLVLKKIFRGLLDQIFTVYGNLQWKKNP